MTHKTIDSDVDDAVHVEGARCSASAVLRWAGLSALINGATDAVQFSTRRVHAESVLVHAGQTFERLYTVVAGSFKCVQVDSEGYEQVMGFGFRGDMLGLDGLYKSRNTVTVVALEDATVAVLPFRELVASGQHIPALAELLHHGAGFELLHRSETQYLMSAANAEVRVARFLAHFSRRQREMGLSDRRLRLRMSRRDIASCLGIAHETVSRALTVLAQCGSITVSHRDIDIVNPDKLDAFQRGSRQPPVQAARRSKPVLVAGKCFPIEPTIWSERSGDDQVSRHISRSQSDDVWAVANDQRRSLS